MISAIQNLIDYLDPTNAHRIVNLSPYDPFAIFGFILLALIVPISLILLTVVARRSVYSIMVRVKHEGIYRRLKRSARAPGRGRVVAPLLPTLRSEEVLGTGGGGVVRGGKGEGKTAKHWDKGAVDAASKQSMPDQQSPVVPSTAPDPRYPTKKEKKGSRSKPSPQPAPTQTPSMKPLQRPPDSYTTSYVTEKPAVAKTKPPVVPQPSPAKPPPSKRTERPPNKPGPVVVSEKLAAKAMRSSQIAPAIPVRSPIEPTFEELFDEWEAAQRAPRIDFVVEEDPRTRREWFVELLAEIRGAGLRARLDG
ncbi:hypothetical protein NU195Hw_Modified_312t1 [Hortaea werneckii]